MTRAEWEAEVVEKTLSGNLPKTALLRSIFLFGPCEFCGELVSETHQLAPTLKLLSCACLGHQATAIQDDLVRKCANCKTLLGVRSVYKAGSVSKDGKIVGGQQYQRIQCECGYLMSRVP